MTDKNDDKRHAPQTAAATTTTTQTAPMKPQTGVEAGAYNAAQEFPAPPMPERQNAADGYVRPVGMPNPYPKVLYHPVYGGVNVASVEEEMGLYPQGAWYPSAAEADMHRTHGEAVLVQAKQMADKLKQLEEANRQVVAGSVQADEALRGQQGAAV